MLNLLVLLFLREKRSIYVSRLSIVTRFTAAIINFFFYHYASKAFRPETGFFPVDQEWSLFEFVIIGEIALFFGSDAMVTFSQHTRTIIRENILDSLLMARTPLYKVLLLMGASTFLLGSSGIVFQFLVLGFVFDITYPFINLLKAGLLNLSFMPVFIGLGFFSATIMLLFRRGSGGLGALIGAMGILSGAYFPVTVFPHWLERSLIYLNPMFTLLQETRALLKTGTGDLPFFQLILIVLSSGALMMFLGIASFNFAITLYKKRGEPALLGD